MGMNMEYIHIKNLEKYHPGYKDRPFSWLKVKTDTVDGDPDMELLDEIDWGRFFRMALLELRAKKPLPNTEEYWVRHGFNRLKTRPIEHTLKALNGFIERIQEENANPLRSPDGGVTPIKNERIIDKSRVEYINNNRVEKKCTFDFEVLWDLYPNKVGKKISEKHFNATIKTEKDFENIRAALDNYLKSDRVKKGFIQNGSTWFNDWQGWIAVGLPKGTGPECFEVKK